MSKAPGSTVAAMVADGETLLEIEVMTEWSTDDIKELALEEGFGLNAASMRFQKVAKGKPAPMGIVRRPAEEPAVFTCGVQDQITGRSCARTRGHDGNHQDGSGNRAWSQTDTGAAPEPTATESTAASVSPMDGTGSGGSGASTVHPAAESTTDPVPTDEIREWRNAKGITPDGDVIRVGLGHRDEAVRVFAQAARDAIDILAAEIIRAEDRTAALADVERLEHELDLARERAGLPTVPPRRRDLPVAQGGGSAMSPDRPNAALVREWARENGITVPPVGLLKKAIVEQYLAAQQVAS